MSEYEKTTSPNIVLDTSTGVLLNTDMGAYEAMKRARIEKRRAVAFEEKVATLVIKMDDAMQRIGDLENVVNVLRSRLGE